MLSLAVSLIILAAPEESTEAPAPEPLPVEYPRSAPARGSVDGPWAFVSLGPSLGAGTVTRPVYDAFVSLTGSIAAGWGAELEGIRLVPVLSFASQVELTEPALVLTPAGVRSGSRFGWTPLSLTIASPDLVHDTRFTGIRITPIVGLTMPTRPLDQGPITTPSIAAQVERRIGWVELAWRPSLAYSITRVRFDPMVIVANRFFAEAWFLPTLSAALGVTVRTVWATTMRSEDFVDGTVQMTWAPLKNFGATLELAATQQLSKSFCPNCFEAKFPFWATDKANGTQLMLHLWFRSDAALTRNWLDF